MMMLTIKLATSNSNKGNTFLGENSLYIFFNVDLCTP